MAKIDPDQCRIDLVRKAVQDSESFPSAFDWINEKEAERAADDPRNRGLTATEIVELARDWILIKDGRIKCVPERRQYQERRHFHYDILIDGIDGFPRGLYVEMELLVEDSETPTVNILNAPPSS